MLGDMIMRGLRPAGDLRDGDVVPHLGQIRWVEVTGGMVAFSQTNADAHSVQHLPVDMEIWIERDEDCRTPFTVHPLTFLPVHR